MSRYPLPRPVAHPRWLAVLLVAALLTVVLGAGDPANALALMATTAALFAASERRDRDMTLAIGLAAGMAPAGFLLAPLCAGVAIRRGTAQHLPLGIVAGIAVQRVMPWHIADTALPNLALLAAHRPDLLALIAATGIGTAAWLAARAVAAPPAAVFDEARLGALLLACILPLPLGALGFLVALALAPFPATTRLHAANDNARVRHQTIRLAA